MHSFDRCSRGRKPLFFQLFYYNAETLADAPDGRRRVCFSSIFALNVIYCLSNALPVGNMRCEYGAARKRIKSQNRNLMFLI